MTPQAPPLPILENMPTGILGLDESTCGGLPKGRPTLVSGDAGSGKTFLAMKFLVNGGTVWRNQKARDRDAELGRNQVLELRGRGLERKRVALEARVVALKARLEAQADEVSRLRARDSREAGRRKSDCKVMGPWRGVDLATADESRNAVPANGGTL